MSLAEDIESTSPGFADDASRWQAILDRDPAADGAFLYSVRTTGVYCRPTCGSRLPRRENVAFHRTPDAAEAAGFRACKRCKPRDEPLAQARAKSIAEICRFIEEAEEPPALGELAALAGLSRYHFHRTFKAVTGVTPKDYATSCRSRRVREGLQSARSVTEALYDAGFNSSARFYATSGEVLGMSPTAFRRGGHGAAIRFAVGQSSLGLVLVAATEKGVCAILLGDDRELLLADLKARFPRADLSPADAAFEAVVAMVVGYVQSPAQGLELPLDVRGTAFQQRVWEALRGIPCGATASYAQVAARIGSPGAARAVARACAANNIAVAIPCHRVVGADGAISGYRWGVERKRALLACERTG
jgi:AraC family transcriptional regulator of adaptative response/methylated-DNA-[protein]-cysteine methyltransferase